MKSNSLQRLDEALVAFDEAQAELILAIEKVIKEQEKEVKLKNIIQTPYDKIVYNIEKVAKNPDEESDVEVLAIDSAENTTFVSNLGLDSLYELGVEIANTLG